MKTNKKNNKITQHSFLIEDANQYGVDSAVILYNIRFWLDSNLANERNIEDGRVWTFNSIKAFAELFPYFSERQIERRLNKLEEAGILISGNYNKMKYDRTKWYSIAEKDYQVINDEEQDGEMEDTNVVKSISPNGGMETTKHVNGTHQTVEPIPDNKPDVNKNKKHKIENADKKTVSADFESLNNTSQPERNNEKNKIDIKLSALDRTPTKNKTINNSRAKQFANEAVQELETWNL